jgi:hypothetical protein
VFVQYWVDSWAGCGRRGACGVVVVLSYPSVLAFQWFAYPVAVCGFVLELPLLVHLVLPEFGRFAVVCLVFTVFEPSVLVLGFPVCVS